MALRSSLTYEPKPRRRRKPIILVGGDKGGVGKSFAARVLAGWMRRYGYLLIGVDGDPRNAHLERYYGAAFPVTRPYLRSDRGWTDLFRGWEDAADDTAVIVDLAGNSGDAVEREMERIRLMATAFNREIIHVWVADEEEDSVTLFERMHPLAEWRHTLVILNGRFGANPGAFELWAGSDVRRDLLANGGCETLLPALPISARTQIARTHCGFDDLTPAGLSIHQRVDFDIWWSKVERALVGFAKIMGHAA